MLYNKSQSITGTAEAVAVVTIFFNFLGFFAFGTGGHGVGRVLSGGVNGWYATSALQNIPAKNGIVGVLPIP